MASGCGDWDAIERTWDLARYAAMQRHWTQVAPPAHIALAAMIGFKPRRARGGGEVVDDPAELARQLRALGMMG